MRKLLTLSLLLTLVLPAVAAPNIVKGRTYRFVCRSYNGTGYIAVGSLNGSQSPLCYVLNSTPSADAYWTVTATKDGHYTLCNAQTGQYITYDGEYTTYKRYLDLTDAPDGIRSEWDIESDNGYYIIRRAEEPSDVFNVRTNTGIVGTYTASWIERNEQFLLYDNFGNLVEEKDDNPTPVTEAIELQFNDKAPVWDSRYTRFMHTIPETSMGGNDYTATVTYTPVDSEKSYVLTIDGTPVSSGADYTFTEVSGGKTYTLTLSDGENEPVAAELTFTSLPIVEINGSFSSTYAPGNLRVNQWFSTGVDSLYNAKLKWRGATAMGKPKKSYAIKVLDANQASKDVSFLGLREDNNWILDAAYVDLSRIRNRVSTDLWNDFSTPPAYFAQEPKAVNGTRGRFVEVLLNGAYEGVYCMTEKVDRKQLKLKKIKMTETESTVRGCLYKSDQWSYSVLMGHDMGSRYYPQLSPAAYDNNSMTWDNWEMKYPDLEDGEIVDWEPLYNAIDFVATSSSTAFRTHVSKYFDMPVVLDYYLFIELILATDNHGKNLYWHCYNRQDTEPTQLNKQAVRMSLTPWDLDGTWGRRWDGSLTYTTPEQDFVDFLWAHEHGELTLYKRLKELDYQNWTDSLALRYALLRQSYFDEEALVERFSRYLDEFDLSGAGDRETTRWVKSDAGALDFDAERSILADWIHKRLMYLDNQYDIENVLEAVKVQQVEARVRLHGGSGRILVETDRPLRTTLYNLAGIAVRQLDLPTGITEVDGLPKGVYLLEGHKVMVK